MSEVLDALRAEIFGLAMLGAVLGTIVAGLMRGYAGFGTAVILAPIYSTIWGTWQGVPVMLLMELLISIQMLPHAFRDADRRVVLPIGGTAFLTMPLGTWVLFAADPTDLRRAIGALVLVFGCLLMSGWRYHGSRPLWLNMTVGGAAGLLKGATGMSGPPVILYLLAGKEEAKRHRANLILFFALIAIISVVGPIVGGLVDATTIARLIVTLPVMLLSVRIGARLFHVVPERLYRPFAMAVLVASGSVALFS
ncbi:sulfite exporter TauE/SafE family protein [Rhodovarius crocodyli]|uniref:Probable membrane transporter protein n=1 Tax=Rhodovarius crocodyli TaxID=1979269 RepID=A0A437MIG0_9PROT|nr:sulfite exporter TauE/SafE family protein [Rhodovarius crocodyli]RVT97430.1 sulfite exporter TauE/SafE family protein [Rhodovarius crocodyli]